jgi:hypothetical protein
MVVRENKQEKMKCLMMEEEEQEKQEEPSDDEITSNLLSLPTCP